jgi:nitrite reductase/ring-hydroxylating ferredoxin subunit
MSDESADSTLARRQLLKAGTAGLAAAVLPGCTTEAVPFYIPPTDGTFILPDGGMAMVNPDGSISPVTPDGSSPPDAQMTQDGQPPPPVDAGPDAQPPPQDAGVDSPPPPMCTTNSNTLTLPISAHPELSQVGAALALNDSRYSDPDCQQQDFYVVQTSQGQYAAYSLSCNHACCTLFIQGSSLACPCHGATFDVSNGAHTGGPGHQLPKLPSVCTDGTNVYVQLK